MQGTDKHRGDAIDNPGKKKKKEGDGKLGHKTEKNTKESDIYDGVVCNNKQTNKQTNTHTFFVSFFLFFFFFLSF